jgi:hypothetical protein
LYLRAAGVVEGDAGLENLYGYVESVHKHILKNMETSEVEDANGKIQVEAI